MAYVCDSELTLNSYHQRDAFATQTFDYEIGLQAQALLNAGGRRSYAHSRTHRTHGGQNPICRNARNG